MTINTLWKTDHSHCTLQLTDDPNTWQRVLVLAQDGAETRRIGVMEDELLSMSNRWHAEMVDAERFPNGADLVAEGYLHALRARLHNLVPHRTV
jgi:hypothetical protein